MGEQDQTVQRLMEELQATSAKVSGAEAEAAVARGEVEEKNGMLAYVSEEVDRLKELFAVKVRLSLLRLAPPSPRLALPERARGAALRQRTVVPERAVCRPGVG